MAHAISNGAVSQHLANLKPGPISHSRWLTKANRLLCLYVATDNPSDNLKILATYIIKVYAPMYFNIKYNSSVVCGSALFGKFIRWTRYLEPQLRDEVDTRIQNNAYRNNLDDPFVLRDYKKPAINFACTDYTNMIDLNDDKNLFEPPFTRNIPYGDLELFLDEDDPPLDDPKIPSHIQNTERHVQLLADVSKRVLEGSREGVMAVTLESREKQPRLESKQDFKE